jgi:uncharacterized membrane protein
MGTISTLLGRDAAAFIDQNHVMQIFAIIACMTAVYAAGREAWRQMNWLRNLEDSYFYEYRVTRLNQISKPETIRRKLDEIDEKKATNLQNAWARFWILLVMGIAVPSCVMMFTAAYYGWFFVEATPLLNMDTGHAVASPTLSEIVSFMLSQIAHAPLDLLEVFGFDVSNISFDRDYHLFALLVFLYRSLIGGFLGAAGVFLFRVLRFRNAKGKDQIALEGMLAENQV